MWLHEVDEENASLNEKNVAHGDKCFKRFTKACKQVFDDTKTRQVGDSTTLSFYATGSIVDFEIEENIWENFDGDYVYFVRDRNGQHFDTDQFTKAIREYLKISLTNQNMLEIFVLGKKQLKDVEDLKKKQNSVMTELDNVKF